MMRGTAVHDTCLMTSPSSTRHASHPHQQFSTGLLAVVAEVAHLPHSRAADVDADAGGVE